MACGLCRAVSPGGALAIRHAFPGDGRGTLSKQRVLSTRTADNSRDVKRGNSSRERNPSRRDRFRYQTYEMAA